MSRAPSPHAPRRGPNQLRTVFLLVALVISVAVMGFAPELVSGQPTTAVDAPAAVTTAPAVQRVAVPPATSTTPIPAPEPLGLVVVSDPEPGDLRRGDGDTLPSDYTPSPAGEIRADQVYGPDPMHRYDLYLPAGEVPAEGAPLIIYLHSGGWVGGDRSYVPDMVLRFLDLGYAIASVEYRLAPDSVFPGPVTDVARAIRELKAMGIATGELDPDRFVVYGTSAGGHLGALASMTVDRFEPADLSIGAEQVDASVAGIVSAVGPTDLVQLYSHPNPWAAPMSGTFMGCFPECTPDQLEIANLAPHLHADIPPAYWAYGALDPLVDADAQGLLIAQQWADAGGDSYLDLVDDGDHNLDETVVNQRALEAFVADAVAR
ncbi:MAG: alpha/beta hydrolase [Actinomycetota bacterium]